MKLISGDGWISGCYSWLTGWKCEEPPDNDGSGGIEGNGEIKRENKKDRSPKRLPNIINTFSHAAAIQMPCQWTNPGNENNLVPELQKITEKEEELCAKVSENRKNNNKFQVELIIGYREGASETGCLCRSSSLSLWPIVSDSLFCSGRIITYLNLVSRVRFDWLSLWTGWMASPSVERLGIGGECNENWWLDWMTGWVY